MSDPSVVIEPTSNNWRSDNNNDNYRQYQTSLSGRRSRRIGLEKNIDTRRGGDRDWPLHPPLQLIHLQTLARESLEDLNVPIKREGNIHLLLPLPQYLIVRYVTMADTREIDTVHRLYRTRKFYSLRKYQISRQ